MRVVERPGLPGAPGGLPEKNGSKDFSLLPYE